MSKGWKIVGVLILVILTTLSILRLIGIHEANTRNDITNIQTSLTTSHNIIGTWFTPVRDDLNVIRTQLSDNTRRLTEIENKITRIADADKVSAEELKKEIKKTQTQLSDIGLRLDQMAETSKTATKANKALLEDLQRETKIIEGKLSDLHSDVGNVFAVVERLETENAILKQRVAELKTAIENHTHTVIVAPPQVVVVPPQVVVVPAPEDSSGPGHHDDEDDDDHHHHDDDD